MLLNRPIWKGSISVLILSVLALFTSSSAFAQGGVWATKAPMPTARGGFGVGTINGKVYVVGGQLHNSATMTGTACSARSVCVAPAFRPIFASSLFEIRNRIVR